MKYFAGFQVYYKKDYQGLERYRNGNRLINTTNVYNCEERGGKLALCSLDKERLEGVITEVLKTLWSIEKGETGNGSKNKRGHEQKAIKKTVH